MARQGGIKAPSRSSKIILSQAEFQAWNRRAAPRGSSSAAPCAGARPCRFLFSILITFLVVILVLYLVDLLPIDGRAKQIVRVIVIILGVLSLLRYCRSS